MGKKRLLAECGLAGLVFLGGCGKKEAREEQPRDSSAAGSPVATPIDPKTVATVSGTVRFEGTAPKLAKIDMSQDPGCQGENAAENIVVRDGKLGNVFVYVKVGLGGRKFDAPKDAVTLTQMGCRYRPHVLGAMTGQTIKIVNADPTMHNVHPVPKHNEEWNESQTAQGSLEKVFAREELLLPITCNQHPWMRMFVNVVGNPFYAVSGSDGKFQITGLPPGDYTLAFVHEKLGEREQKVTLAAKDSKTIDMAFKF